VNGESPNLVFGGLIRVVIFNRVADTPVFSLEDLLDLSFAVKDIVVRTADGSVFDDITDLGEIFGTPCSDVDEG